MMYIPSAEEAAKKIVQYYRAERYDQLREVDEYLQNMDVAYTIAGNGDEFHNATVRLAHAGFYDYAYALAKVGQYRHKRNTDLLGDLLCYGLHCRPLEELECWYTKLERINERFWTWRAYQFSFDYWMERLPDAENDDQLTAWEDNIFSLIKQFQDNFKYLKDQSDCEKAYMMEYTYYSSKGDEENALNALKQATMDMRTQNKCAQCALKLADHYFEIGDYENAYRYATLAVSIKEDQASISLGYAYYILAMSLEWKERKNNSIPSTIKQVFNAYNSACMHLEPDKGHLMESVKKQVRQLEFEYEKQSGIDFDRIDQQNNSAILGLLSALGNSGDD